MASRDRGSGLRRGRLAHDRVDDMSEVVAENRRLCCIVTRQRLSSPISSDVLRIDVRPLMIAVMPGGALRSYNVGEGVALSPQGRGEAGRWSKEEEKCKGR